MKQNWPLPCISISLESQHSKPVREIHAQLVNVQYIGAVQYFVHPFHFVTFVMRVQKGASNLQYVAGICW